MTETSIVPCPACGQQNRVRAVARGIPECGKCGAVLPWLVDVSTSEFQAAVDGSPLPVLVDFWAPWCGPCRAIGPVVERIAAEQAGRLKVARVNTDDEPGLGRRFGVQGIPTLVLVRGGEERDRIVGPPPGQVLPDWVRSRL